MVWKERTERTRTRPFGRDTWNNGACGGGRGSGMWMAAYREHERSWLLRTAGTSPSQVCVDTNALGHQPLSLTRCESTSIPDVVVVVVVVVRSEGIPNLCAAVVPSAGIATGVPVPVPVFVFVPVFVPDVPAVLLHTPSPAIHS